MAASRQDYLKILPNKKFYECGLNITNIASNYTTKPIRMSLEVKSKARPQARLLGTSTTTRISLGVRRIWVMRFHYLTRDRKENMEPMPCWKLEMRSNRWAQNP